MKTLNKIVESLSTNTVVEGPVFDKVVNKLDNALTTIGQLKSNKIADSFDDLYDKISNYCKLQPNDDIELVEKLGNNIIIGNEQAPLVLIPEKNIEKSDDGGVLSFWVGYDVKIPISNNSIVTRDNGTYRKYNNLDKFYDDLLEVDMDDYESDNQ